MLLASFLRSLLDIIFFEILSRFNSFMGTKNLSSESIKRERRYIPSISFQSTHKTTKNIDKKLVLFSFPPPQPGQARTKKGMDILSKPQIYVDTLWLN